jgi:hypothetical protein
MGLSTNLISGLASGFDWRSMIDELMKIERRPGRSSVGPLI